MADTTPGGLRIGNAERDQATALLREHTAAGRLDLEEFEERVGQVTAARTNADLDAVLIDLPAIELPGGRPSPRPYSPPSYSPPSYSPPSYLAPSPQGRGHGSPELHHPRASHRPVRGWAKLALLMLAIWAIVGFGHFWLAWVIVPIAFSSLGGCGRSRSSHHPHRHISA